MGDKSKIEWTDASWNPVVGCSIVSPGCTNCYAMRMAERVSRMTEGTTGLSGSYGELTKRVNGKPVWTGALRLVERKLTEPLRWKKPRMIFVNSMGDLFHESVPDEWIARVFAVMQIAHQHTYQVLTKRADRMRAWMSAPDRSENLDIAIHALGKQLGLGGAIVAEALLGRPVKFPWPAPHIWMGISAEDQKRADERISDLLHTPATVRFISAEPLLGPINLTHIDLPGGDEEIFPLRWPEGRDDEPCHPFLDWVIAGGESGPKARPMHPDWARSLRDQCEAAGVPFFFKQWGEWKSAKGGTHFMAHSGTYRRVGSGPQADDICIYKIGKTQAGRLLDGREHNGMPEVRR